MRKNVCGFVSQTRQCRRSSKSDRGDRGMKFNWFRICTAYRRPMTSRPNMVTKVIVRYASHWKRNCKLKSQRHEKDTSVERKKKKKIFFENSSDARSTRACSFRAPRRDKHNGRLWNRVKGCQTSFKLRAWRIDGRIVTRSKGKKKSGWDHPRTWPTSVIIALCIYALPRSSRLQVIAMCTRHTPLDIPLTLIKRAARVVRMRLGRCLFT